ncbi:MAG: NAD-dependent epimerase/dehydratase family protein, partial [Candidatus Bathyarchaeia archaeon]
MSHLDAGILVTGGAGFIGSHLVDSLMRKGGKITLLDNLSTGSMDNVAQWIEHSNFTFIKGDCLNREEIHKAIKDCELVFHLAANPEVRVGAVDTKIDFEQNILATYNVLEEMRKSETAKRILFTSTSTVYGDAKILPTPEEYGPLEPISLYGASKLACEALISGYCHMFNMQGVIYRFANVVGSRSRHGVIWDFIHKLLENPLELEILGDGSQTKSYLMVEDCADALLFGLEQASKEVEIYNIGSEDQTSVKKIAKIVAEEMGLKEVEFRYTGGIRGGRGWIGDVKTMFLDISKIKRLGWKPRHNSAES